MNSDGDSANSPKAQVFGQVIDFYLSPEGNVHLPAINKLAKENSHQSDQLLLQYIMEGVRLNGTFGAYRRASRDVTIYDNGKPVVFEKGRTAFTSFLQIARDPKIYPEPEKVSSKTLPQIQLNFMIVDVKRKLRPS